MKKIEKMEILQTSIGTYNLCRFYFIYDPNYWYFYILNVSEKFVLGVEEDDFMLDGFEIRKISDIRRLEIKDDMCPKINEENRILDGIEKPQIELSSWKSIFESLKKLSTLIIVENEKTDKGNDFFYMGHITEVGKSFVILSAFDAGGVWFDSGKIPYSEITSVIFNSRYTQTWQKYLEKNQM